METCPQYLLLEESVYDDPDFTEAAKFVCAPPIRTVADQEALWLALGDGEIQTVSTDHCSFTTAQKRAGRYDFTKIPGGLPGVETRGVLLYNRRRGGRTHHRGGPVPRPERKSGQAIWVLARKGVIAPGSDADIVVYDPAADSVITAADQVQNVDYNPYEGSIRISISPRCTSEGIWPWTAGGSWRKTGAHLFQEALAASDRPPPMERAPAAMRCRGSFLLFCQVCCLENIGVA